MSVIPTHRTPPIWHHVTCFCFHKWNSSWKDAGLIPLRRSRPNNRKCLTLWQKRTSRKRSKKKRRRCDRYLHVEGHYIEGDEGR
jgi:hypothetical protein